MLQTIGLPRLEDLFASIPDEIRLKEPLQIPHSLSEMELRQLLRQISRQNAHGEEWTSFLGAGAYAHYLPSPVSQLLLRGEFLTAYTPYQPEVSQGTLQAIFEYQTMVAEILGMEIANASNYDGSTATAEAILMSQRLNDRPKVLVARSLHPEYRQVLKTYLSHQHSTLVEIPYTEEGCLDQKFLSSVLDSETSCLVASVPNFFGIVEDFEDLATTLHEKGILLILTSPEPLAFGLFKSPGEMGADIAVGEGSGIGGALNFGGPSLGFFATQTKYLRSIPGRIVGETTDGDGRRGFVLTLATREQHIRRERATSNICTNVSLCALAAAITLALWGRQGFREIAEKNFQLTEELKKKIAGLSGFQIPFSGTTFNEFVIKPTQKVDQLLEKLREEKILGGVSIARWYPELENSLLVCVTELTPPDQLGRFVNLLGKL